MSNLPPDASMGDTLRLLAGYLNFSSGTSDAATLAAWNDIYFAASQGDPLSGPAAWLVVKDWLQRHSGDAQPGTGRLSRRRTGLASDHSAVE